MPGKLYMKNVRLSKAYSEGFANGGGEGSNPHPVGTPAADAWDAGDTHGQSLDGSEYAGSAECSQGVTVPVTLPDGNDAAVPPVEEIPEPPVEDTPDETWIKADIQQWLTDHSIDYPSSATKAELIALVPAEV